MDSRTQLASTATGFQDPGYRHYWLFHTRQSTSGGVGLTYGKHSQAGNGLVDWSGKDRSVEQMAHVDPDSPIVANQAGSVFAIENKGGRKKLVMWTVDDFGTVTRRGHVETRLREA